MKNNHPIIGGLYRVKRGLAGYISYLAACEMNESFSEYILYEPTLRILAAQGWTVRCEYPCPGYPKRSAGDVKKLDFVCQHGKYGRIAIEMKWVKTTKLNATSDIEKLRKYISAFPGSRGFLFIFGRMSHIKHVNLMTHGIAESGEPVYAELGVTRFGCRNYEIVAT